MTFDVYYFIYCNAFFDATEVERSSTAATTTLNDLCNLLFS